MLSCVRNAKFSSCFLVFYYHLLAIYVYTMTKQIHKINTEIMIINNNLDKHILLFFLSYKSLKLYFKLIKKSIR